MKDFFRNTDYLNLSIERRENVVTVTCSNEVEDNRKSQLYINESRVQSNLEDLWSRLKTRSAKLKSINVSFSEIDHYDSDVNLYDVPSFSIGRGLRKAKLSHYQTGTVPKEWEVHVTGTFEHGRTKKPFTDFVDRLLNLSSEQKVELEKKLGKVLRGEESSEYMELYEGDD